jgi:cation-transporting ATPase E
MTGDGVNDILPVRTANVGVAMSSGSPATRGVADLVLVKDDFSIVPEAIRDGQRIVTAMAATLTLLLARTFYVLMIIVGAAIAGLPFPLTPRENSILALVTVGIPVLVFAAWVEPRPTHPRLLHLTLRTSIPLSIGLTAVALPVYVGAIAGGATPGVARTILTTLTTFLGIGAVTLIPIAAVEWGRIRVAGPLRTVGLVAALAAGYLAILATDAGRAFFELQALPAELVVALAAIAAAWTVVVLVLDHLGTVQAGIDILLTHRRRGLRLKRAIGCVVPAKRAAALDAN